MSTDDGPSHAGLRDISRDSGDVAAYYDDWAATVRELARVVRPGGPMVLTQRADLFDERDDTTSLSDLDGAGVIHAVDVSAPEPYLPGNDEFGEEVLVRFVTCRSGRPGNAADDGRRAP